MEITACKPKSLKAADIKVMEEDTSIQRKQHLYSLGNCGDVQSIRHLMFLTTGV